MHEEMPKFLNLEFVGGSVIWRFGVQGFKGFRVQGLGLRVLNLGLEPTKDYNVHGAHGVL